MKNLHIIRKFAKGMFALFTLNFLVMAITYSFNSCQRNDIENVNNKAATNFLAALELNKKLVGSTPVDIVSEKLILTKNMKARSYVQSDNIQMVYLTFPEPISADIQSQVKNIKSVETLSNFAGANNATINYKPNEEIAINGGELEAKIPVDEIYETLTPLIGEAKVYLKSKGFTEQDIQDMLVENNAHDYDLVLFVMGLSSIECSQEQHLVNVSLLEHNYNLLVENVNAGNNVTWKDYASCAVSAIGIDVFWALSGSMAKTWTVAVIKQVFKAALPKILGPVGVGIAVASFGWCIANKYGVFN